MSSDDSSVDTDVDALESTDESSSATDLQAVDESYSGADSSSSSDGTLSESAYSQCFSSSTTSTDDLPNWRQIRRQALRDPVEQQLLDPIQKMYVCGWGKDMLARTGMKNAVRRFLDYDLPVMSDCSGAEGGLLALKELGIQVDHVSSCESNHKAVEFIAHNFKPRVFYPDVCERELEDVNYGCAALIAGFPCQFSRLRKESLLLEEEDAKPFFAIIETLKLLKLPLFILENVLGIRKCMKVIRGLIRKHLPEYFLGLLQLNAKDLGDIVSRPRIYFIGIHRRYAAPHISSNDDLQSQISEVLRNARSPPSFKWPDLLLEDVSGEEEGGMPSKRRPTDPLPKWRHIHWSFMKDNKVNPKKLNKSEKAIDILSTLHGESKPRIVNASQQLNRMHIKRHIVPCLTPGSAMYVMHRGRCLTGLEMMLFQGFDVSQLNLFGMEDKVDSVWRVEWDPGLLQLILPDGMLAIGGDAADPVTVRIEWCKHEIPFVFHGDEDDASEDDVYQKNGKSKKRLVLKAVYILVASFWSLTKGGQDALLWSMQNPMWVPDSDDDDVLPAASKILYCCINVR
ncbi:nlaIVM [Symbiodinium microadriaticum]|nr:nlaIVM [Symbiodinium microadriaticum]